MSLEADKRLGLSPTNVPVQNRLPESNSEPGKVVRRTEILIERKICSVEIHGSVQLKPGEFCPVCGQKVALVAELALNEKTLSASAAKRPGESDGNSAMNSSTNKGSDGGKPL